MKKRSRLFVITATILLSTGLVLGLSACEDEHVHKYVDEVTAPTCLEQGYTTHTCACGETYADTYIEALGHTEVTESAVAPTCEETGLTESKRCSVCETVLTAQNTIPALGHEFEDYHSDNNATCEADGTETATCSRTGCEETDTRTKANSALGHEFVEYASDGNATYTADGTKTASCTRTGCQETDTVTDTGSKLDSMIRFKTFTVSGQTVKGAVSNATAEFSFTDEVEVMGVVSYVVAKDKYGLQTYQLKTVPLEVGDNTFYIFEKENGEVTANYTVTVRRRPMYEITFETNGGTAVETQTIEEDLYATEPETTRTGYTFAGWDHDFAQPITGDKTITASWTANTDTAYKVEYYLQNLENDEYTLTATENKTGTTDTTAQAEIKTFEHFTATEEVVSGNINGDGSLVLKVYYTRDTYTVTFDGDGANLLSGSARQTVKYGGSAVAPNYQKTGYTFLSFDREFTNVSENITVLAQWQINRYTLTIVYGNGQADKIITQDYNTAIESVADPTDRAGYVFDGWDMKIPTHIPAYNLTVTAKWINIFVFSDNTVRGLSEYGETLSVILMPNAIDGQQITAIGQNAFFDCDNLTSIVLADGIASIGEEAFAACSNLSSIIISQDNAAFKTIDGNLYTKDGKTLVQYANGKAATSFTVPVGVTAIGNSAFFGCSTLTSVTLTENVASIGNRAFYKCVNLTNIVLSDAVTSIGEDAFYNCNKITSATTSGFAVSYIPKTNLQTVEITSGAIGNGAFSECTSLINVTIGNGVTSIGYSAFDGCSNLTNVTIGNGVTQIGDYPFRGCDNLIYNVKDNLKYLGNEQNKYLYLDGVTATTITSAPIDGNCKIIGLYAFDRCVSLTEIVIPDSVISIRSCAFMDCSNLTNVTIGKGVREIEYATFYGCDSLTSITIPDSVISIRSCAFMDCSNLTNVTIGKGVTRIGLCAFEDCDSLTEITIPDGVTRIGTQAFEDCDSLTIYCEAAEQPSGWAPDWNSSNRPVWWNCKNNDATDEGIAFTVIDGVRYTVKEGVGVVIEQSKTIQTANIVSVLSYKNNSYNVTTIEYSAFENCTNLTEVTIPDSVTTIEGNAFFGCSSLTYTVKDNLKYLGNEQNKYLYLDGVTAKTIASAPIAESCKLIGVRAFDSCASLTEIVIPNGVITIGGGAFWACSNLSKITIPDSVTLIGQNVFYECNALTYTVKDNLKYLGNEQNKYLYLAGVTSTDVTSVLIDENCRFIGDYAFMDCSGLTEIVIPDGVVSIGSWAFLNCGGLTEIVIPNSVVGLYDYPFYNCSNLTVYCRATTKPSGWGWSSAWSSGTKAVVWGYTGEDE